MRFVSCSRNELALINAKIQIILNSNFIAIKL